MLRAFILLDISKVTMSLGSLIPESSKNFYIPSTSMFPVDSSLYLLNVATILSTDVDAAEPPPSRTPLTKISSAA